MEINVEEYYRKYSPMVLRRCRYLLKNEDMALDAMQETFMNLLKNKSKLRGDYPSSLLHRIATNVCLNIIRSEKRSSYESDEILNAIADMQEGAEDKLIIRDLIDSVFNREHVTTKEIAVMYYVDKMTHEEVADEIGLSVSGVRKRLRNLKLRAAEMKEEFL